MDNVIMTQNQLKDLAKKIGVRKDWHEPDEQEVTARITGLSFDNAMCDRSEMTVVIYKADNYVGEINLAMLLAMACGNTFNNGF